MINNNCYVDLHLHLDGAISPESARMLAKMQGIELPESEEELIRQLRVSDNCRDLNEFLEKFAFPCSLLQTKEGVKYAVKNLLSELEEQGVMYAEIRFAPQKHCEKGMTQIDAVIAALDGIKESGIPANLILCCMRGGSGDDNLETVRIASEYKNKGVVAVDLAGAEALFSTKDYGYIFDHAKKLGVRSTIHAGEADGPDSVREAIKFGASRIGHGVRAAEDDELVVELAQLGIPLERCPTSNLCTCVLSDISEYPIRKFLDAGVIVTINTDDPSIEGTTIREEYEKLIDAFGLTEGEVRELLRNSVKASFATDELKEKMMSKIV